MIRALDLITPHLFVSRLDQIDPSLLGSLKLRGLLLDLDCTLINYGEVEVPEKTRAWIRSMGAAGIKLCLVSNASSQRVEQLGREMGILLGVANASKPLPSGCRRGIALLGIPARETAMVGDQVFADVLSGRLAGLFTILVSPTTTVEPWFTRLKRPIEKQWLNYLTRNSRKR